MTIKSINFDSFISHFKYFLLLSFDKIGRESWVYDVSDMVFCQDTFCKKSRFLKSSWQPSTGYCTS